MTTETKSEYPKLDARGRASVFHFDDGWIRRAPIDCREICEARQGAPVPTRTQFVAWAKRLEARDKGKATNWPQDSGPPPYWFHDALVEAGAAEAPPAPDPDVEARKAAEAEKTAEASDPDEI